MRFKISIKGIWVHVLLMLVGVGFITLPMFLIKRSHTFLDIGDKFVTGQQGILKKKTLNTSLKRIDAVGIDQSVLGRLLDYGNIIITSGSSTHTFSTMEKPQELKKIIESRI